MLRVGGVRRAMPMSAGSEKLLVAGAIIFRLGTPKP